MKKLTSQKKLWQSDIGSSKHSHTPVSKHDADDAVSGPAEGSSLFPCVSVQSYFISLGMGTEVCGKTGGFSKQ